jgi:hypothetical protein
MMNSEPFYVRSWPACVAIEEGRRYVTFRPEHVRKLIRELVKTMRQRCGKDWDPKLFEEEKT